MDTDNFIGAKISITTASALRFVGTIYQLDPTERSMTLTDVRCYGTENRPVAKLVPASDQVYAFMRFSGEHIVDLVVIDEKQQPSLPVPIIDDPAIVSATLAPPAPIKAKELEPKPAIKGSLVSEVKPEQQVHDLEKFALKSRELQAEIDKLTVEEKEVKAYDKKSSFFDNLQTDTRERVSVNQLQDQRKKDIETFGSTERPKYRGTSNRGGYRGRGYRRGRGTRGFTTYTNEF